MCVGERDRQLVGDREKESEKGSAKERETE